MLQNLREHKRFGMVVILALLAVPITIMFLASMLYRSDLRYERGLYSVSKNYATTFCVVANNGRRTAEKSRMFVGFESRIHNIRFSPGSAGKLVGMTPDSCGALLELSNVKPGDAITAFFSVERSQNTPFHVQLLDISADIPLRERAVPLR